MWGGTMIHLNRELRQIRKKPMSRSLHSKGLYSKFTIINCAINQSYIHLNIFYLINFNSKYTD